MTETWRLDWTCWQPTPYNDCFFEALAQDGGFNLTVHYRQPRVASHPWRSDLASGYHSRLFDRTAGVDWHLLNLGLRQSGLFVLAGWNDPTSIALLNTLMARRHPFAIWTDTPDTKTVRAPVKRALRSVWLRRVFLHAAAVMGTGKPALTALSQMGCPPVKLRNLPYSIDLSRFRPLARRAAPEVPVFLSCGRLHSDKGYDVALQALARVYGGQRDKGFVYRIAGDGPDAARLRTMAADLGIGSSVQFLGWIEPSELPGLYASADIFLHPARREPYGVSVLEAMASGLVVIGSAATAAVEDRVVHAVNGFVHAPDDISGLADIVAAVTSTRPTLDCLKHAARTTAEEWPVSRAVDTVRTVCAAALRSRTEPASV